MEIQTCSDKIFVYQRIIVTTCQSEQDYFVKHMNIIETIIGQHLMSQLPPTKSIVMLSRSLQILLNRDRYTQIHQNLIKLFQNIYKRLLLHLRSQPQCNCLLSLLHYYKTKKHNYKLIFSILNNVMPVYSKQDRESIQSKAYKIWCKEIMNQGLSEQIGREMMGLVEGYRAGEGEGEIQKQLRFVKQLGIFACCQLQFLQTSKQYYISLSTKIIKNQSMFLIIECALQRQTALNKILTPSQNTTYYVLKQLIEQYFPFMMQYVEQLMQQGKQQLMRILWSNTLKLGAKALQMLENRFEGIIRGCSKYLKGKHQNLLSILNFIAQISHMISQCFHNNKHMHNLLTNTIESLLIQQEHVYNQALSKHILVDHVQHSPEHIYNQALSKHILVDHVQHSQEHIYNQAISKNILVDHVQHSQEVIFKLFKLVPNKQNFIKQLQIRFFRWLLHCQVNALCFQQQVMQMIKKQCGGSLCKKMQRMIHDVWRDGEMVYHSNREGTFRCRMLSSEWPKFTYENISLPAQLSQIIAKFQGEFRHSPQNMNKQIKWVNQFGTILLSINGTSSLFSQIQASTILILAKFSRPMKQQQISQTLQLALHLTCVLLDQLHLNSILTLNPHNHTYQINETNLSPYRYHRTARQDFQQIKILTQRDDGVIIQAWIVKILKKKKIMQKTDLTTAVMDSIHTFRATFEQINAALAKLIVREFVDVDKMKGIIRYKE